MKKLAWILIVALLVFSSAVAQETEGTFSRETLTHDEVERVYTLYTPPNYDSAQPAPVILGLHSFASSGRALEALSGLSGLADEMGALLVYPESYYKGWNEGREAIGEGVFEPSTDDQGYLLSLLDQLGETHNVDAERVYLVGFGQGGVMAQYLACQTPDRFAGAASVGALMWQYHLVVCPVDTGATDLLIILGTKDTVYPVEGRVPDGTDSPNLRTTTLEGTLIYWLTRNQCNPESQKISANRAAISYSGCQDDTSVNFFRVPDASNSWPRVGDYHLNRYGVDATELIGKFFMGDENWAEGEFTNEITTENPARTHTLYVPTTYDASKPTPLVFVLTGRPGTGGGMALITNFEPVAEEKGFIAVFPDHFDSWNYTNGIPIYSRQPDAFIDDVQFFVDLIDDLALDLNIDRERVYVTGFSNGGYMTQRVACEAPDHFAAFVAVGSGLRPEFTDVCAETQPAPMMLIHGTNDISVRWAGSVSAIDTPSLSVPYTVGFWAQRNGCAADYEFEMIPNAEEVDITRVFRYEFADCEVDFEFYAIQNGGHNWPGVNGIIGPEIAGNVSQDIFASEVVWEFFSRHTLNGN